jgi:hypothetical protein
MRTVTLQRWLLLTLVTSTLLAPRAFGELAHRYTFTADANDSIGTAHGTLHGGAVIGSDAVLLDGVAGTYVELPPGLLEGYTSVTLETWAITDVNANWNRLFDFGDINAANQGRNYLFVSTHSGAADVRVVISDADPGFNNEEIASIPGNLDNAGFVHVVAVVDPPNGWLALYIDGQLANSNPNLTIPLSAVATNYCWLGRSLYAADPYYVGGIEDFRIHSSALNSGEIAAAFQAGPDAVDYDPGTLTALTLALPAQMRVNGIATPTLTGTYSNVGQIPLGLAEVTLSSSDPSVVGVQPNGTLRGLAAGPATITATLGGATATANITVLEVAAVLRHRYSMNEPAGSTTVVDAIGGQNGTLHPAAQGGNVVTLGTGRAVFPGGASYVNGAYIDLPDYLLNTKTNVTIETWSTWRGPAGTPWSRIFDFGTSSKGDNPHLGGFGTSSFWLSPSSGAGVVRFDAWNGGANTPVLTGPATLPIDQESHVVCIYAPDSGVSQLWVNGVLVASGNAPFALSTMQDVNNWLGISQWDDAPLNGEINEFRIYEGALGEFDIVLRRQAGPDALPADPGPLQSIALEAPETLLNGNPQPAQASILATFQNMADIDVTSLSSVIFTSSDPQVFTVTANGQLRPVSLGSADLTAEYGGLSETMEVQVADPTALTLTVPSPLPAGGYLNIVLMADYESAPSTDVRTFAGATFDSDNLNVATVTAAGAVLPLRVGTVTLTGNFAGLSASTNVEVALPDAHEPGTLIHRYSFGEASGSTTVSDSVGTAHGELRNPTATSDFNGTGRLLLAGGAWNAVPEPAYVNLPNGLVSSLTSVTLEAWVRWSGPADSSWQRIFDFGRNSAVDGAGNFLEDTYVNPGLSYMFLSPRSGANTIRFAIKQGDGPELPVLDVPPMPVNTDTHVAVVYDTAAGAARLYVNGQRLATGPITHPLSVVEDLNVYLGRAQWTDPHFAGEFDEFRVYRGTFLDDEVAAAFAAGADQLPDLTPQPRLGFSLVNDNLELSWPVSATGFILESATALGAETDWTTVSTEPTVEGDMNKVAVPVTGGAGYYRLKN